MSPRVDTLSFDQAWSPCSTRHETDDRTEFDSTAQPTVPPNKIAQQSSSSFVLSLIRSPLGHSIDSARSFVSADYPSAGFDAFCPSSPTRSNRRTSPWCSSGEQHIQTFTIEAHGEQNLAYRKLTRTVSVDPKQLSEKRPDKTHHHNRLHVHRCRQGSILAHRNCHHSHIHNLTQHEVQKFHSSFTKDDPKYGSTYHRSGSESSAIEPTSCARSYVAKFLVGLCGGGERVCLVRCDGEVV